MIRLKNLKQNHRCLISYLCVSSLQKREISIKRYVILNWSKSTKYIDVNANM
jgi:hypothetical protein